MEVLTTTKGWIRQFTEIGLLLLALFIVLQLLFGQVSFMKVDVVGNLITLIKALGDNGVVGLIALAIILWLFNKKTA